MYQFETRMIICKSNRIVALSCAAGAGDLAPSLQPSARHLEQTKAGLNKNQRYDIEHLLDPL